MIACVNTALKEADDTDGEFRNNVPIGESVL
jgi:hypothetical protein